MIRGDQVYVMRPLINMDGVYQHHGIHCGDGTVIHYYKGGVQPTITRTSFETFALGKPVFVKSYDVCYLPDVVIERAESRLGEQQYNLLTNNCEHFATWCKTGRNQSQQLLDYGVGLGSIDPIQSRLLVDQTAQDGDAIATVELFADALNSAETTRLSLQSQAKRFQQEMDTWQRVAQAALARNREDLARAALERKVKLKKQWNQIQTQLQDLNNMEATLIRNSQTLQERIAIDPAYAAKLSSQR